MSSGPVLVLACPRSYSSLFGSMMGQHPDLYGLPEVKLFTAGTVGRLITLFRLFHVFKLDGLARAVAELEFGAQTDEAVAEALAWIQDRRQWTTRRLWDHLAERAAPRRLVEKSPINVLLPGALERMRQSCPDARYIHLHRHPRTNCRSLHEALAWVHDRYTVPLHRMVDPEWVWRRAHLRIQAFTATLPPEQVIRIRGEDVIADATPVLRDVAQRLSLSTDPAAIEAMLHPERSPFSRLGPKAAPLGNDPNFLDNPVYTPHTPAPVSLDGPLDWPGGRRSGFKPRTLALARALGYD